ncbi:MAG: hypothetical protein WBB22_07365, partial [Anaerolineae bacterium]
EDAILRQHYRGELNMAETLTRLDNRTEQSVRCRMRKLGLKRDYSTKPKWEWVHSTILTIESPVVPG